MHLINCAILQSRKSLHNTIDSRKSLMYYCHVVEKVCNKQDPGKTRPCQKLLCTSQLHISTNCKQIQPEIFRVDCGMGKPPRAGGTERLAVTSAGLKAPSRQVACLSLRTFGNEAFSPLWTPPCATSERNSWAKREPPFKKVCCPFLPSDKAKCTRSPHRSQHF